MGGDHAFNFEEETQMIAFFLTKISHVPRANYEILSQVYHTLLLNLFFQNPSKNNYEFSNFVEVSLVCSWQKIMYILFL